MANWRQIQGRIRRARTSADPIGKLAELYQKTRDAMVAFEAASFAEKAGRTDEAVRWFTAAAESFRRAEWRQRAADALTRLGAPVPEFTAETPKHAPPEAEVAPEAEFAAPSPISAEAAEDTSPSAEEDQEPAQPLSASASAAPGDHRKRRRGRRGGRRHKRRGAGASAASPSARQTLPRAARAEIEEAAPPIIEPARFGETISLRGESDPGQFVERATYIRAGEPALASRFAQLESLLRRLVSGPLHRVDEVEDAPAGPGVFLLSDSDLTTNYYVEACQTLRVGAGQLLRAGRAGRGARERGGSSLRAQLAEHLGVSEAKVSDYLNKHCVVRWLQLDTDAPHVAHFAIAVLRPALNNE